VWNRLKGGARRPTVRMPDVACGTPKMSQPAGRMGFQPSPRPALLDLAGLDPGRFCAAQWGSGARRSTRNRSLPASSEPYAAQRGATPEVL
jgi:hypothetical protein